MRYLGLEGSLFAFIRCLSLHAVLKTQSDYRFKIKYLPKYRIKNIFIALLEIVFIKPHGKNFSKAQFFPAKYEYLENMIGDDDYRT